MQATFEVWVTWSGGDNWQRIFDFGDAASAGNGYIFMTPQDRDSVLMTGVTPTNADATDRAKAAAALAIDTETHLVVVVGADAVTLYQDGAEAASVESTAFTSIEDVSNYLGRSHHDQDPYFTGTMSEFRVWGGAMTPAQVTASMTSGPDTLPTIE